MQLAGVLRSSIGASTRYLPSALFQCITGRNGDGEMGTDLLLTLQRNMM